MPRIRTVKPAFFDDHEFVVGLSRDVRLFYIGLWVRACDDHGVFPDSGPWLLKEVFPYDRDLTPETITAWCDELERQHRIVRYAVAGKQYACVIRFLDHQKVDKPSRSTMLPEPPGSEFDRVAWRWITPPVANSQVTACLAEDSVTTPGGLGEPSRLEVVVGSGSGVGTGSTPPVAPPAPKRARAARSKAAAPTRRPQDALWEALAEHFATATESERSLVGRARRELIEANATPEQVHERVAEARRRWNGTPFTPKALVQHWTSLADTRPGSMRRGNDTVQRAIRRAEEAENAEQRSAEGSRAAGGLLPGSELG